MAMACAIVAAAFIACCCYRRSKAVTGSFKRLDPGNDTEWLGGTPGHRSHVTQKKL